MEKCAKIRENCEVAIQYGRLWQAIVVNDMESQTMIIEGANQTISKN